MHHQALRALGNRLVGILHGYATTAPTTNTKPGHTGGPPPRLDTLRPWDVQTGDLSENQPVLTDEPGPVHPATDLALAPSARHRGEPIRHAPGSGANVVVALGGVRRVGPVALELFPEPFGTVIIVPFGSAVLSATVRASESASSTKVNSRIGYCCAMHLLSIVSANPYPETAALKLAAPSN